MTELQFAITYFRSRFVTKMAEAKADERGIGAVEWLIIILAVITIAGLAVAFVTNYVNKKGTQLNNQP
jgi:hypothetical protein